MSSVSFALRRSPLLTTPSALPRVKLLTQHLVPRRATLFQTSFRMGKEQNRGEEQDRGEETTGLSEWKQRPPYRVHEKQDHFDVKYEAACHCGKVEYQLSRREPLDSKLCHCTTCQTQHAAPFQWAAIFHKTDINFTRGHHDLEWYDPSSKSVSHKLPCKVRCSFCHSPIMDEGRNMILLFPSLIKFKNDEDKKYFKPRMHMFYGQRVMDIPDGLPKWSGLNEGEDSELIEDSPPEQVRERERGREGKRKRKLEEGDKEEITKEGSGANTA